MRDANQKLKLIFLLHVTTFIKGSLEFYPQQNLLTKILNIDTKIMVMKTMLECKIYNLQQC